MPDPSARARRRDNTSIGKVYKCVICGRPLHKRGTVTVADENGKLNNAAHHHCVFASEDARTNHESWRTKTMT